MTKGSIGVDVGGSFTDVVYVGDGPTLRAKAPTNPEDFGDGVLNGVRLIAAQAGLELEDLLARVERMGLGTTAVTNVVTALSGSRVGLIVTQGFEDELNLARGIRPSGPEGRVSAPVQLVPRRDIVGIDERIDRLGTVLSPLDTDEVVAAARHLVEERGVEALAISFVSSYRDARHERAAAEAVAAELPDVPLFVASEFAQTVGYFQRTVFAVLNAYSASSLDGVDEFIEVIRSHGLDAPIRLVNATGGAIGVAAAKRVPMVLMHSGPAAGVSAASTVGRSMALDKVVACDMGGTSFDISVINDGTPLRELNAEILGVPTSLSVVDVESIGSGGGSIGWVDSRGMLRVGPKSARSFPGPACYGRGGTEPTVTDALIVLGYIDGDHFLGGSMKLDRGAAVDACGLLGEQLGMTAERVALGIWTLALADMLAAVRLVFNRRGLDVRDYSVMSYGGCGSLFTGEIARRLGMPRVVVPEVASVLSAFGAATAGVRHERSKSLSVELPCEPAPVDSALADLARDVMADLESDQVPEADRTLTFEADLRYKRQKFELSIPLSAESDTAAMLKGLEESFFAAYAAIYGSGSSLLGAPVELVTLRVVGQGPAPVHEADDGAAAPAEPWLPEPHQRRRVVADDASIVEDVPVFAGRDLGVGAVIQGPACVDKVDTTIWLPPESVSRVAADGSLIIEFRPVAVEGV